MKKLIGIDLFCGAGGLSLGAEKSGVEVVFAIDSDKHAIETYEYNFTNTKIQLDEIQNITLPTLDRFGKELIVFGGPPCQGFSTSNQRTRTVTNSSNWLFRDFFKVVEETSPEWVVFENVRGLLETERGAFFREIIIHLKRLGYLVSHKVINACDFGVPQIRSRLFIVGNNYGKLFKFPAPNTNQPIPISDALADLPKLVNGASECWREYSSLPSTAYCKRLRNGDCGCFNNLVTENSSAVIERYRHIPQGGNWEDIPPILMRNYKNLNKCHTGIYRRLEWNKPSVVIGNYRKNMLIHPLEHRGLSVREAARIQSFPDEFVFKGSIGFQQQQVGNAVPPLLAQEIFNSILSAT